jgi:glycosyltransferase involved in cell wall biosynthesis
MIYSNNVTRFLNKVEFKPNFGFLASGWALDKAVNEEKVIINLVVDGETIATSSAYHFNRALYEKGVGNGFHAFSFLIPTESVLKHNHKVVYAIANGDCIGLSVISFDRRRDFKNTLFDHGTLEDKDHGFAQLAPEDVPTDLICGICILPNGGVFDATWYVRAYPEVAEWCRETQASPYFHYLRIGKAENRWPHVPFNETWYSARYGHVISQMNDVHAKGPFTHYIVSGSVFGFDGIQDFDEQTYLDDHPDVSRSVKEREILSGYYHYVMYGASEGRQMPLNATLPPLPLHQLVQTPDFSAWHKTDPNSPDQNGRNWAVTNAKRFPIRPLSDSFAQSLYESLRPDVKDAVDKGALPSVAEHWRSYGVVEEMTGNMARLPRYRENRYLTENPDVSAVLSSGAISSGYDHFLCYGYAEKRRGGIEREYPAPRTVSPATILQRIADRDGWPLISIIMPAYETPETWLRGAIDSVLEQLYPFWELCIVNDASPSPHVYEVIEEYAARDSRIRVTHLPANSGISTASNAALSLAKGEWIALMDHDDRLTEDALYMVASTVVDTDADAVYSDEAKMSVEGQLYDFTYKPDWSPDFLHSTMYIGHLTCYRKAVVDEVGGFRSEYDGTQDYDLALRVAAITDRFVHIPEVLYYWVAIPGSTAETLSAKNYAVERQRMAIEDAVARHAVTAFEAQPHWSPGNWRVVYAPPSPAPLVSIVIPSAGRIVDLLGMKVDLLKNCILSLFGSECYENFEIVVVHNGDLEQSTEQFLRACNKVKLVHYSSPVFNFSEKINLGVTHSHGDYVLLLNDDTQAISKHFLRDMVGRICQPGIGIVGPRLLFANSTIQHVGMVLLNGAPAHALIGEHRKTDGPQGIAQLVHNAVGVTGACMLISRKLYTDIGGFDEGFPLNYNDADLCHKVSREGLRIVVDPGIELYHFESLSKVGTFNWELQKFMRRWGIQPDPYVNVNFLQSNPFYEVKRDRPARECQSVDRQIMVRLDRSHMRKKGAEPLLFSFFLSVYRTPVRLLRELENTILHQFYENFEWVIVNNGDHRPEALQWFADVGQHPKVRVIQLNENQGIMGGYGAAFEATIGDYVLPVDADDFLTLDALEILADHIHQHDFPAALYSDEFKSNMRSDMFSPFHKPDFDRVLFFNICYVAHLCAIRRSVAIEVGAYKDMGATWCHDWDSFTRIDRAGQRIVHVPHLLYAWRINPGSTASIESSGKPETLISQEHVLSQHLALTGLEKRLSLTENSLFSHPGIWRLLPKEGLPYRVATVINVNSVNDDTVDSIIAILALQGISVFSIRVATPSNEVADILRDRLHRSGVDQAVLARLMIYTRLVTALLSQAASDGEYVFFAQADLLPKDGVSLRELAGLLHGVDEAVAVGGRLLDTRGKVAWAGGFFGIGGFLASADYGRDEDDSGYHGMAFCQRFVDGVSPSHWVVRADFLENLLQAIPDETPADQIGSAIALRAYAEDRRVLYTPFSVWKLLHRTYIQPPIPSESLLQSLAVTVPRASRWYNPRLHTSSELCYQPAGYI